MVNNFFCNINVTNEQRTILEGPSNVIVSGAAGTGKTMLAILLAQKLAPENKVGVIIYTKALREFIREAIDNKNVEVFNATWDDYLEQDYDYLIVDEVQDFTLDAIKNILRHKGKGVYFFGDDSQQIYDWHERKATIDEIGKETGFPLITLTQNMRLSAPIGRFLRNILPAFTLGQSILNQSDILPDVEHFESMEEEQEYIATLASHKMGGTIAVILSSNEKVMNYYRYFQKHIKNKPVGYKNNGANNLIFNKEESVNVLTYHSAKGLEFDHVIIPDGGYHDSEGKCMYVGCTRSRYSLVLTDNGNGCYVTETPSALYNGESHKKYMRSFEIREELHQVELELIRKKTFYEIYSTDAMLIKECEKLTEQIAGLEEKKVALDNEYAQVATK